MLHKQFGGDKKDKMKRFINGLKSYIQKDLSVVELKSHANTLDKVLKAEKAQNKVDKERNLRDKKNII